MGCRFKGDSICDSFRLSKGVREFNRKCNKIYFWNLQIFILRMSLAQYRPKISPYKPCEIKMFVGVALLLYLFILTSVLNTLARLFVIKGLKTLLLLLPLCVMMCQFLANNKGQLYNSFTVLLAVELTLFFSLAISTHSQ